MADNTLSETNVTGTQVVNGVLTEQSPPVYSFGGTYLTAGIQTTSGLSRGILTNTGVGYTNANLSHACDINFVLTGFNLDVTGLFPNFGMITAAIQNGRNAAANVVRGSLAKLIAGFRLAINAIVTGLNLDPSGELSKAFSRYKKIIRDINEKIKIIAQMVADAAFYYYLVQELKQVVEWIQSLPEKFAAMFKDCLTKFSNSVNSIPAQISASLAQAQAAISSGLKSSLTTDQQTLGGVQVDPALVDAINDPLFAGVSSINSAVASATAGANITLSGSFANQKANSSKP
jgi:hypothetical protein